MGRRPTALLGAIVGGVVFAGSAQAATVLSFNPVRAAPGERVVGTTVGAGMRGITSGRVVVLLARSDRDANAATGPDDRRLMRFGVMSADNEDVGRFSGRVPAVEAGSYVAVAYCRECVEGGSIFTVGEFKVTGAALPRTGFGPSMWMIGFSLVAAGVFLTRRKDAQFAFHTGKPSPPSVTDPHTSLREG